MNPPHPDDEATIQTLADDLRRRRLSAHVSLVEMSHRMGTSPPRLCELERWPHPNVFVSTLHRAAVGLGTDLAFRFDGLPEVEDRCATSMAAMFAQTGNPTYLGSHLMARVRAERIRQGLSLARLGALIGAGESAVHRMENPVGELKTATPMRLWRALGGVLGMSLVDVVEEATAA
jgi:transcriptional regulator with XRE-family HTH domain